MEKIYATVGLVGAAGAGKDSVADVLVDQLGFKKLGFADPLRRLCVRLFGWDLERLTVLEYKEAVSNHDPAWMSDINGWSLVQEQFPHGGNSWTQAVEHLYREFTKIEPTWTRRQIMQHVGTECFRAFDDWHWIKQAMLTVDRAQSDGSPRVVLTDLRFENEAAAIRQLGGQVWWIRKIGGARTTHSEHVSESGIEEIGRRADIEICAAAGEMEKLRRSALFAGRLVVGGTVDDGE